MKAHVGACTARGGMYSVRRNVQCDREAFASSRGKPSVLAVRRPTCENLRKCLHPSRGVASEYMYGVLSSSAVISVSFRGSVMRQREEPDIWCHTHLTRRPKTYTCMEGTRFSYHHTTFSKISRLHTS